jgi:single-stranded-DNA-specific exonuclease
MAAGFSVTASKLDVFREFLSAQFAQEGQATSAAFELNLDAAISPSGATAALVTDIARAGPFGSGNPEPLIVAPDVRVVFADVVGKDHVRLRLAGGDGARLDAIAFRAAKSPLGEGLISSRGNMIHAAGRLRADEWNGRARVQLYLEDAAFAQQ